MSCMPPLRAGVLHSHILSLFASLATVSSHGELQIKTTSNVFDTSSMYESWRSWRATPAPHHPQRPKVASQLVFLARHQDPLSIAFQLIGWEAVMYMQRFEIW